MKTTISIPDELFRAAEDLAQRMDISRSRLYREAIIEYLGRHGGDPVTEQINAVCCEVETGVDAGLAGVATGVLRSSEW